MTRNQWADELLRRILDDHDEEPEKTLSQWALDQLMENVRDYLAEWEGEPA